jgi:hypothetical protein
MMQRYPALNYGYCCRSYGLTYRYGRAGILGDERLFDGGLVGLVLFDDLPQLPVYFVEAVGHLH